MDRARHAEVHPRIRAQTASAVLHACDAESATGLRPDAGAALLQVKAQGDRAVATLAATQHGVVTRAQLVAAGLGRGAIAHRIDAGRLHRVHQGVYLVGHRSPPSLARETAAVLAYGAGAVLSHRSAAAVLRLLPGSHAEVDVTVVGRHCRTRPGVCLHQVAELHPRELTRRHGIAMTTPARILLDLAADGPIRQVERALAEARARRLVRTGDLRAVLERSPGRKGSAPLRALLQAEGEPALVRSEAEERLLALVRGARLASPEANARVGSLEVDLLWRAERLVVEVDGFAFHSSRASFERDRLRDSGLQAVGFRVVRVTWRQIIEEPVMIVARLAQALAGPHRPV